MTLKTQNGSRYRLLSLLGRGALGEVYLAHDTYLERQIAVKVMRFYTIPDADSQVAHKALLLFKRETQVLAQLRHPHILPLFDYGQVLVGGNSCLSFVMPLCLGGSLATWLRQRGGPPLLSPSEVSTILLQVADALQSAHRQHITHLNIKAENLLIASRNASSPPNVLLADFGVATLAAAVPDGRQGAFGSPIAMAPEQWEGHPVAASDQYALAVLAYSLLVGRPPYIGNTQQLMYQHLHTQPQPLGHFVRSLPTALDAILLRALAKRPQDRFDSVLSFAQTFAQTLAHPSAITMQGQGQGAAGLLQRFGGATASREAQRPSKETVPAMAPSSFVAHRLSPRRVMGVVLLLFAMLILTSSILFARLGATPQSALVNKNTASVHVAPTSTTMKAVPNPYPPHIGTLVFSDVMSNDSFNWTTGSTNDATCLFSNRAYQVIGKKSGAINPCLGSGQLFSNYHNFVFEVNMTLIDGTGGGMRFRISSVGSYNMVLYQGGYYVLTRTDSAGDFQAKLLGGSATMKRGLQQTNILAVVASGVQIDLYVNHIHIGSTHDGFSGQGAFGLVADQMSQVAFSNARLWTW